jgi:outer membrane lipoprotein-sorting protein
MEIRLAGAAGRLTWTRAAATGLLVAALPMFVVTDAGALDAVPLPRERPQYAQAARADPVAAIATPTIQISADSRFTRDQQIALHNINTYFNSFQTMQGEFIQFGPNGEQSEGVFFMTKPGKIRFHSKPPIKLDVIADGSTVAIVDGKMRTQDLYPLSKTPLRYLLAEHIDLTSENIVSEVQEEHDLISLVIVEDSALVEGKLTMIFDRKTFELRQWVITDAQGYETSVAIYNVSTGKRNDPGLFRITISHSN